MKLVYLSPTSLLFLGILDKARQSTHHQCRKVHLHVWHQISGGSSWWFRGMGAQNQRRQSRRFRHVRVSSQYAACSKLLCASTSGSSGGHYFGWIGNLLGCGKYHQHHLCGQTYPSATLSCPMGTSREAHRLHVYTRGSVSVNQQSWNHCELVNHPESRRWRWGSLLMSSWSDRSHQRQNTRPHRWQFARSAHKYCCGGMASALATT